MMIDVGGPEAQPTVGSTILGQTGLVVSGHEPEDEQVSGIPQSFLL